MRATILAALFLCTNALPSAAAPQRVVSMNLCTDQLAMLMASEGQLLSVSHLARDPGGSVLFEEAKRYAVNHGLAEEIFMMRPDLVVAGTFTNRASVAMLRRLGFRVEEFPPSYSFAEIRDQIRRMGKLLEREARAEELVQELNRRLTETTLRDPTRRPLAALQYANNYTSGTNTLASEGVERAGLENLGARLGLQGTVRLPLEVLVMSAPNLIVGSVRQWARPALAYQTFEHPALRAVVHGRELAFIPDKYWICGAPFTAEAVKILTEKANQMDLPRQ